VSHFLFLKADEKRWQIKMANDLLQREKPPKA
jgi:hypothetical protein